ncbi:MAG: DUF3105 domain-containing protein [Streptosporangiaceae bacterium]
MGKASRAKQDSGRREKVAAQRAAERRRERRRRLLWFGGGGAIVVAVVAVIAVVAVTSSGGGREAIPPGPSGTIKVQPAAITVPNTTGISGVVAYDTNGYPSSSQSGPANQALGHTHVTGPVRYSVTPPVGGNHYGTWLTCGVYDKPVPDEYAVHDLEHGTVWITYQPSLPASKVSQLRAFFARQTVITPPGASGGSRYTDLTPYPGLPAPIVATSWGYQLRLSSPTDPRLQQFVSKFRVSQQYTPEYGAACSGGLGTPLQQ